MTTSIEKATLRRQLEKYEGKISHLYLDSKGYVTVGIGHLLSTLASAQKLAFKKATHQPASAADIKLDYETVKKQVANRLASSYKKHTKLTLSNTDIDKLTDKHIDTFEQELKKVYIGFTAFPSDVRFALFDMIFNLGMTNLRNTWPMFNAAINKKDWQKAADNSNRKSPISAARNKYVKDLLVKAAKEAEALAKLKKQ